METKERYIKTGKVYRVSEREKKIEEKFRNKIKDLGGTAYKFVSPGRAGVPDRLVILPGGRIGFAELKRHNGKPTKLQKMQMSFIRKLGCYVKVIYSEEDIDTFIQGLNLWHNVKAKSRKDTAK